MALKLFQKGCKSSLYGETWQLHPKPARALPDPGSAVCFGAARSRFSNVLWRCQIQVQQCALTLPDPGPAMCFGAARSRFSNVLGRCQIQVQQCASALPDPGPAMFSGAARSRFSNMPVVWTSIAGGADKLPEAESYHHKILAPNRDSLTATQHAQCNPSSPLHVAEPASLHQQLASTCARQQVSPTCQCSIVWHA